MIPWSLLPWERSRSSRLLNACTDYDLRMFETLRLGFVIGNNPAINILPFPVWDVTRARREQHAWLRTTPLLSPFYTLDSESSGWRWTREETQRRATRIIMAIEGWKVEHQGELPERLSQLRGSYLSDVPLDPYSAGVFYYVREGIASPGWPTVPRNPFIWSIGERVRINRDNDQHDWNTHRQLPGNGGGEVWILDDRGGSRHPVDEYDVWFSGQWFDIP